MDLTQSLVSAILQNVLRYAAVLAVCSRTRGRVTWSRAFLRRHGSNKVRHEKRKIGKEHSGVVTGS